MTMKRYLLSALFCAAMFGSAIAGQGQDANVAEAKSIIKEFFGTLKGELEAAVKSGGPANAITVCQQRAPAIAHEMSAKTGWQVGRTSLKLRNPANMPDAWELEVLNKFEQRKAAGEDPAKIAYAEVVDQYGKKRFRFMKAIPTAELCLNCHGSELKPEVVKALDKHYAADKARGFKVGDLRGAFTLSKPL
jgi:hypothetical protein